MPADAETRTAVRQILTGQGATRALTGWLADDVTSVELGTLPAAAYVPRVHVQVTEAFNSDGTDTLTVGTAADADAYATAVDVSTTGIKTVTLGASAGYVATAVAVVAAYAAGGSAPTTGKALVVLDYLAVPTAVV